jgi:hypothetical protein
MWVPLPALDQRCTCLAYIPCTSGASAKSYLFYTPHLRWPSSTPPAAVRGSFIPAGHPYDAFVSVGDIMKPARRDIMMLDAYANERILDFVLLAPSSWRS